MVDELERRLAAMPELPPYRDLPGAGAAGGLGRRSPSLGASSSRARELVLDRDRVRRAWPRAPTLVVTGEGTVDRVDVRGQGARRGAGAACRRSASAACSSAAE